MNRNLRKAVLAGLGIAALAGVSSQASAQTYTAAGTIVAGTPFTSSATVANYAWDGHNNPFAHGAGWGHNTHWYTFSVASATGLTILETSTSTGYNPAFSLYKTSGYTDPASGSGSGHTYSQVSTQSVSGWLADPAEGGATSFVGYANSGPSFTNYWGSNVGSGSGGTVTVSAGQAKLHTVVAAGDYLLAVGGSNFAGTHSGSGAYNLVVSVPEPEEYLMMLLGGGMVGFQIKRKKAKQAAAV